MVVVADVYLVRTVAHTNYRTPNLLTKIDWMTGFKTPTKAYFVATSFLNIGDIFVEIRRKYCAI